MTWWLSAENAYTQWGFKDTYAMNYNQVAHIEGPNADRYCNHDAATNLHNCEVKGRPIR